MKNKPSKVTKADLVEMLAAKTNIAPQKIHGVIDELQGEMKRALLSGKTTELRTLFPRNCIAVATLVISNNRSI